MSDQREALLITAASDRQTLSDALVRAGLVPIVSSTVAQAKAALGFRGKLIVLVICEHTLPDGTFRDVLRFASLSDLPVPVVVASPVADVELYLEAMKLGAFDFIAFPYRAPELAIILNAALQAPAALALTMGAAA